MAKLEINNGYLHKSIAGFSNIKIQTQSVNIFEISGRRILHEKRK